MFVRLNLIERSGFLSARAGAMDSCEGSSRTQGMMSWPAREDARGGGAETGYLKEGEPH